MNKEKNTSALLVQWFFICFLCVNAATQFWQARSPYMPPIFATLSYITGATSAMSALFLILFGRAPRWATILIGIMFVALLGLWLYVRYAVLRPPT